MVPTGGGSPEERRAEGVTETALKLVQGVKTPLFLWVHYYDPHYDYRPPEPYASEFRKNPYDGEIAYMDASIGKLLEGLRKDGLLVNALIVIAGDHGEGLLEHGERQHGIFLYEYALHVPLLMAREGRIHPRSRIADLCGLADLAPTVLDLMGQGSLSGTDGVSLKALLEGRSLPPRTLYAESYHGSFTYGWAPQRASMTERWKFIESPRPELYEWRVSEEKNLYVEGSPAARAARENLRRYPTASMAEKAETERLRHDPAAEETRKRLMSLGYLSGGGVRTEPARLLDPKDAISIEADLLEGKRSLDDGDLPTGIRGLTAILRRNPQNITALSMLGVTYLKSGAFAKAVGCFTEAIRLRPELDSVRLTLGTAYNRMGKTDLAVREYNAALAISPRSAEAA